MLQQILEFIQGIEWRYEGIIELNNKLYKRSLNSGLCVNMLVMHIV